MVELEVPVALVGLEELVAPAVWGESVAREVLVELEASVVLVATGHRNCLQAATMRGNTTRSIGEVLRMAIERRRIGLVVRRADLL